MHNNNEKLRKERIMKKLLMLSIGIFTLASVNIFAQDPPKAKLDTIFKVEGKIMPVDVTKVTTNYVSFTVPGSSEVYRIERKEIHKIIYKNGRIEEYNKPVVMLVDDYSWEAVWLTDNPADVAEMYKRGDAKAESPASSRSPKAAKKNATIRMQKLAAGMKGQVVLVTKRQATGGYGEYPGYYLEGEVYGLEPLDENGEIQDQNNGMNGGVVL